MPEQVTLTLAGQDADILLNYCSTEDITGKPSTQLRAPVLVSILNPNGEVIIQKLFDNTMQANWNCQFGLLIKLVLLSDCNQSEFVDTSVSRGEQTGIIIAGVPFLLSPIPCPFFLPPSFLSYPPSPLYCLLRRLYIYKFSSVWDISFFYPNPPYQADWALLQLLLLLLIHGAAPCLTD